MTPDLEYALGYAGRIGVLWVCVWCPSWEDLTAVALNLGPGGAHLPASARLPALSGGPRPCMASKVFPSMGF